MGGCCRFWRGERAFPRRRVRARNGRGRWISGSRTRLLHVRERVSQLPFVGLREIARIVIQEIIEPFFLAAIMLAQRGTYIGAVSLRQGNGILPHEGDEFVEEARHARGRQSRRD